MPTPESIRVCRRGVRSVKGAAALLGISRSLVWKLIRAGAFETIHYGTKRLIPVVQLQEWLAAKRDETREALR